MVTAHIVLSRLQFALTTMFHITWAATSVGLSALLVVMEGLWLKTGDDAYYHHTRFWGRLFLLNFAVGVVSGVPLEFQFGTNWGPFAAATGGFFGNILGFETVHGLHAGSGFSGHHALRLEPGAPAGSTSSPPAWWPWGLL